MARFSRRQTLGFHLACTDGRREAKVPTEAELALNGKPLPQDQPITASTTAQRIKMRPRTGDGKIHQVLFSNVTAGGNGW